MRFQAIKNVHPTLVRLDADIMAYDANGDIINLDEDKITKEIAKLQAEYDSKQYQRDRAVEYPSIEDQLDEIFHKGLTEWKKTIQAVKDKHPKPTE